MKWIMHLFLLLCLIQQAFAEKKENIDFLTKESLSRCGINPLNKKFGSQKNCIPKAIFGTAGYQAPIPFIDWYPVTVFNYPTATTFSLNRNTGRKEGHIALIPTGLEILKKGTYAINFLAVLTNLLQSDPINVRVFVALNGVFDPNSPLIIEDIATIPQQYIKSTFGSGILKDVPEGTTVSLVVTQLEDATPEPQVVNVVGWGINLLKLPYK